MNRSPYTFGPGLLVALTLLTLLALPASISRAQVTIPADVQPTLTATGRQALQSIVGGANSALTRLNQLYAALLALQPSQAVLLAPNHPIAMGWGQTCSTMVSGINILRADVDTWTSGDTKASEFSLALQAEFRVVGSFAPAIQSYVILQSLDASMRRAISDADACIKRLQQLVTSLNRFTSLVHRVIDEGDDASNQDLGLASSTLRSVARSMVPVFETTTTSVTSFLADNSITSRANSMLTTAETCEEGLTELTYLSSVSTKMTTIMTGVDTFHSNIETGKEDLEEAWEPLIDGDIFDGIEDYSIGSIAELKEWFLDVDGDLREMRDARS